MENRSVLQWDKDDCAAMGLVKFDLLGPRHAVRAALRGRPGPRARRRRGRLRPAGSRGTGGLRDAAAGGLGGGVPGRVPGADGDAAAAQAAHLLRPGGGGRADPSRPDPGRVGAPVHPAPQRAGAGHLRPPGDEAVAGQDAGHPAVPGAADAARRRRRGVRRRRGRPAAPGDGRQAVQPEDGEAEGPALRRDAGPARHHRCRRGQHLRAAAGVRQLRVRRVARAVLRLARLLLVLAQAAPPGGVHRGAAQRAAHGLLLAAVAGRGRPAARGDGAPPRREHLRRAGRSRAGTGRPTGDPAGAGRDPHARHRDRREDRRLPARRRVHVAGPAHPGGHPDRRAGRGDGHRRRARRAERRPPGARSGRPGRRPVRGPARWTAPPSASTRRRCPGCRTSS